MKAKKKTKLIEIEYWDCGMGSCNHRTESGANRCIDKQKKYPAIAMSKNGRNRRQICITKEVLEGRSMREVGEEFGVSGSRVRQIFEKTMRLARRPSVRGEDKIPEGENYSLNDLRKNKSFWLRQVEKLADN